MTATTFGYMKAWAKGTLKTIMEEYEVDKGVLLSGKLQLKQAQAQELIDYLSDPANYNDYGCSVDFALFHNPDDTVVISGKLTTPYVKETNKTASAKRKI